MRILWLVLFATLANATSRFAPDQQQCYTLARLNVLKTLPSLNDGMTSCCSDCLPNTCPCTTGGTGSQAFLQNGVWDCLGCITTTTTTTTTTLAPISNSFLWLPSRQLFTELSGVGFPYPATANQMRCAAWVPTLGLANATTLYGYIQNHAAVGMKCGFAIYTSDPTTGIGVGRVITTGNQACENNGVVVGITGVSFNITAGTRYLVCTCSNHISAPDYSAIFPGPSGANETLALMNALNIPLNTVAAKPCLNGAPPLDTGALTADTTAGIPNIIMGTATP